MVTPVGNGSVSGDETRRDEPTQRHKAAAQGRVQILSVITGGSQRRKRCDEALVSQNIITKRIEIQNAAVCCKGGVLSHVYVGVVRSTGRDAVYCLSCVVKLPS